MKDAFSLVWSQKKLIMCLFALLLVGFVAGRALFVPAKPVFQPIVDAAMVPDNPDRFQETLSLFLHNWVSCLQASCFIVGLVILVLNGFTIGYVYELVRPDNASMYPLHFLFMLLPHGVFEILALVLSAFIGLNLLSFSKVGDRFRVGLQSEAFYMVLFKLHLCVVGLLALAAFVEEYLTLPIYHFVAEFL